MFTICKVWMLCYAHFILDPCILEALINPCNKGPLHYQNHTYYRNSSILNTLYKPCLAFVMKIQWRFLLTVYLGYLITMWSAVTCLPPHSKPHFLQRAYVFFLIAAADQNIRQAFVIWDQRIFHKKTERKSLNINVI